MACVAAKKKVSPYMIMKAAGGLLLEQGTEAPAKMVPPDIGLLRMKAPASRPAPRRAETDGAEINGSARGEISNIPMRQADRFKLSQFATRGPAVSLHFFDRMTRAATEAMGPMANRILGDQISALGESRNAFPQAKLAELILRVSGEILNETMRARFQKTMITEIATLKTM
jgi:hypothetical protein